MNRRRFIESLVKGCVAPMFLKGAGRLWIPNRELITPDPTIIHATYASVWQIHLDNLNFAWQPKWNPGHYFNHSD